MGSIGPAEIIVVLIIGLIVLGPNRLPDAARQIGKAVNEFRRVSAGLQAEVRDAFTEPVPGTPPTTTAPGPSSTTTPPAITEVSAQPTSGPSPWLNPPIAVEGPSANGHADSASASADADPATDDPPSAD